MKATIQTDKLAAGRTHGGSGRRRSLWKGPALVTALLLLIPLWGNHFVEGWNWHPDGFAVVGAVLFALGLVFQLITWERDALAYRAAMGLAFATAFLLAWSSLVQFADVTPAAAMYFGVPLVGVIGAVVARLQPNGMARALFATALAQIAVLVAALVILIARKPQMTFWTPPEWRGFCGNAVVAMLFAGSALLFRKAGREETATGIV